MGRKILFSILAFMIIFISCSKEDTEIIDKEDETETGDPVGTVYFKEHFDKMVSGGDYIANERGFRWIFIRNEKNLAIIDKSQPPEECSPATDGSGDFFLHMDISYLTDIGIADWEGSKVYERPGHIKIGTSTSRDAYVTTPALKAISEEKVDVEVVFNIARWPNASTQVFIEIAGGGIASVEFVEVKKPSSWEEAKFIINDATPKTKIRFMCDPRDESRFFLDDIVVTKI